MASGDASSRSRAVLARSVGLAASLAFCLVILLVGPERARTDTSLPATITSNQTWTAAGSPYTGASVTIASGVTVTVEPGAIVKLSGSLSVNGTLDVNGTAAEPAIFTSSSDTAPGQWYGISLNTSSSSIDHAIVRHSRAGITISGLVSPSITNSTITDNSWQGVQVLGGGAGGNGTPTITGNQIDGNGMNGINVANGGSPIIAANTITDNYPGTTPSTGGGIYYKASSSNQGQVNIHDNVVDGNGAEAGVLISVSNQGSSAISLSDNTVTDNTGKAIYYSTAGSLPTNVDDNPQPTGNGSNAIWLGGTLPSSVTWEDRGYPLVLLSGSVKVASGATLTLNPGLVVKGTYAGTTLGMLSVSGTLVADGTPEDPIVLTSVYDDSVAGDTDGGGSSPAPAPHNWFGISLNTSSSGSRFDNLDMRYARTAISLQSGGGSFTELTNSTIQDSGWYAVWIDVASSPTISGNLITRSGIAGINITRGGSPAVSGNTITASGGDPNKGGGINFEVPSNVSGQVNIHDNVVSGNGGLAGIRVWQGGSPWTGNYTTGTSIGNNTLTSNAGRALQYQIGYGSIPADIDTNPTPTGNGSNAVYVSGHAAASTTWQTPYPLVFIGGYDLIVDQGVTLTLPPGQVMKAETTTSDIDVRGALNAVGEAGNPIRITSLKDDSVGGDTNGDGSATAPAPANWGGVIFAPNATGVLDRVELSYGGGPVIGMVRFDCPCPSSVVRHSKIVRAVAGLQVSGTSPLPTIEWNTIRDNTQYGVDKFGTGNLNIGGVDTGSDILPRSGPNTFTSKVVGTALGSNVDCEGAEQDDECPFGSDPVSLATGALTYDHTDLSLSSKGDPLVLRRVYNSADPQDIGFGPGWAHAGLATALEQESGDVLVRHLNGARDLYTKTGSTYTPPSSVHDVLVKEGDGTFKLTTQDRQIYDFDSQGRIATLTDDHGLVTTWAYGSNGSVSTITDAAGQRLTFTYNAQNKITKVADSTGREVNYTYTAAGDLDTVTDPLGGVTNYDYDSAHRITQITDPRNVTFLRNTYDGQGRVIEQRDGLSNLWTLAYRSGQTTVTEPRGGVTTHTFDSQNRLTALTDQVGNQTTYGYSGAGDLNRITRPGPAEWTFAYDSNGNLTSATDPEGGFRLYGYDSANRITSFTDPRLKTWTYTWSPANDLTEITDPKDQQTTLAYNTAGQPTSVTNPRNKTWAYSYDTRGNLTQVTDPLNHSTAYAYNTRNQLTSMTEPGKPAETYTPNALGDLLAKTTPAGNVTSYEYDGNGGLTKVTDPALKVWRVERNAMERPTAYVDPASNRTEITYDGNLMRTSVTDRRSGVTTYSYDLANQLTSIEQPVGGVWQFGYDARGNRDEVTDPRNDLTTYTYDLADRMTEAAEPLSTTTGYGYDAAGNLTSITDPRGNLTSFEYDELSRLTTINQPLGKQTSYTYDAAGNVASGTTAIGTLNYAYDDADRLTSISDGGSTLRSFAYDDADRLTSATDVQQNTIAIAYNGEDRPTSIDDGRGQTATLSYDSRGNLTRQVDGRGTTDYAYDDLGRMSQLTDPQSQVVGFFYDPEGNLTRTELPNGAVSANTYDADERLTQTTTEMTGQTLESLGYTYDVAGNRTSQTDRLGLTTTYAYDALNRITEFDPPVLPATTYAYDPAGNRTEAGTNTYSYDALNRLTASSELGVPSTTYSYDDAGRLASKTRLGLTTNYSWDALDQLTGVDDGLNPVSYSYDGLGRRSERTQGGSTETAHYGDLTDRPTLDTGAGGAVTQSWIQGPAGLVEERSDGNTSYPIADAHGDLTAIADQAGAVSSRQAYDPWGVQTSGPKREFGWLGAQQRRADLTSDMLQMGVRPYDPALGRFLEEDPVLGRLGRGQSFNRHSYVSNNPLNLYDLDGRIGDVCVFGACASEVPGALVPDRICTPLPGIKGCIGEDGLQACVSLDPMGVVGGCLGDEGFSADVCTPSFGGTGPSYCTDPTRVVQFVKDHCLEFGLGLHATALALGGPVYAGAKLAANAAAEAGALYGFGASEFGALGFDLCHLAQEGEL